MTGPGTIRGRGDRFDPKALILEAYRIDGITLAECRSIFMDWALSLPDGMAADEALPVLIARHAAAAPDHPMTQVLHAGLATPLRPARRGGWRSRRRPRDA